MSHIETPTPPLASPPPILLLIDTDAKWTGREVDSLTLYVDAEVAALTITLPTPQSVNKLPDPTMFDDWIALIQGDAATRCDISVHQRVLLLDIALTYRAFGRGLPNVNTNLFKTFSESLVETARTLDDHESAEDVLRSLIEWIHTKLPDNIFMAPADIPPLAEPSDDLFEPLANLVQLFGALHVSATHPTTPAQAATAPTNAPPPLDAHNAGAESSDPGADSSDGRETAAADGAHAHVPASTGAPGLAPPSTHVSDPTPASTSIRDIPTVSARDAEQCDLASGNSELDLTPDTLAQLIIITTLWGAYSRNELTRAQFLKQVHDGLTAADVPVEPFLTRLADRLPIDDAPLGRLYNSSDDLPGPPIATSVKRADHTGSLRTVRVISEGTATDARAVAHDDGGEDGGYESEDSMPRLETPNDSSDDEAPRLPPRWTEEEFVRAVRNIFLRCAGSAV